MPSIADPMKSPQSDPVQQMREAMAFRRTFSNRLEASAEIAALAVHLMRVHYTYEGWGEPPSPIQPALLAIYVKQAEKAVRRCDDSTQAAALVMGESLAVARFDAVSSCVAHARTDDEKERLIRAYARDLLDTYEHHAQAKAGLSTAERIQLRIDGIDVEERQGPRENPEDANGL